MRMIIITFILCFLGLAVECQEKAEMILKNGKIITMGKEKAQVQALAVRRGKIIAIGSNKEVESYIGKNTQVIDLKGKLAIPGFTESHAHLLDMGQAKMILDVEGTKSEKEIVSMVKKQVQKTEKGTWIIGRGWDQNDWEIKKFPNLELLSKIAPEHPVCLIRIDGHALWVNKKALELEGVTAITTSPKGGRIIKDVKGEPTGIFIDNAMELIKGKDSIIEASRGEKALNLAINECISFGITSFHDAGSNIREIKLYKKLLKQEKLPLRLYVMVYGKKKNIDTIFETGPQIGLGNNHLTIRAIKLLADGALGSRGAALIENYCDEPHKKGLVLLSEEEIFSISLQALQHGFQVCTHAIGDKTNHLVLNNYEKAFKKYYKKKKITTPVKDRFRIEHAQILDEFDIPRFAKLGIIASMQPTHCTSDMPWVHARIGKKRAQEGAYVWQKLIKSGAIIASGSDAPIESVNPLWGFYSAVTRQDHTEKPSKGWYPKQRMSREQALKTFTINAAFASFEETIKGSIEPGKLADIVVLSQDIMTIPVKQILKTKVLMTIIGGKIVYQSK